MQLTEYPRQYLESDFDPGDVEAIRSRFDELDAREIESVDALRQWCRDWSELEASIDEEGSRRFVDHTCHTDDSNIETRYVDFLENIDPLSKTRTYELSKKLASSSFASSLPAEEFSNYLRSIRNSVELFRPANVELETEEAKLDKEYNETVGAMSVTFDGKDQTLPEMSRYLEKTDRSVREAAFRGIWDRFLRDGDKIETLLEKQIGLRHGMARNAGFDDYRAFRFRRLERFDYSPEDCLRFHDSIEKVVVPLQARRNERRKERLGVDRLRPWDLSVDPDGRPPLSPFEGGEALAAGCLEAFRRVDPVLGDHFAFMREQKLLDLESRKGKAPGGYQANMQERRVPFIFMNAAGLHGDVTTMLHEGGHAFHTMEYRGQDLAANRDAPIEFCEVASMAMELLAAPHLDVFYDQEDDLRRARIEHLEGIIGLFPWVAIIDAFQHWLYTTPGHNRADREAHWLSLMDRFGGNVDWDGLDDVKARRWTRQSHLFGVPFYYVEYAIAQLGALQVWKNSLDDCGAAIRSYREALSLGNCRSLPELFQAAEIRFDFSEETVGELLQQVELELEKLEGV